MAAPLLGADGKPAMGVDPQVFAQQKNLDPQNPHVIASQFAAYDQSLHGAPAQGAPPAAPAQPVAPVVPAGTPAPAPAPAPAAAPAPGQEIPPDHRGENEISNTADLAKLFDVPEAKQVFEAISHKIGDRDYTLQEIVEGFTAMPDAITTLQQRDQLESQFTQRGTEQAELHKTAMDSVIAMQAQLKTKLSADKDPTRMQELLDTDPRAFQAENLRIQAAEALFQNNEAELARQQETATRTEETRQAAWATDQAAKLAVKLPEWNDPTHGPVLKAKLSAYARSMGFSDQEMANMADHRFLLVLKDAAMGDAVRSEGKKLIADAKDRKLGAPPAKQAARGETLGKTEIEDKGRADSFRQLTQDHSLASAAEVFKRIT